MNRQRITALFKKELIHILKDPAYLFLVIIFPIVITAAFGISFGQFGTNSDSAYTIGVINLDAQSSFNDAGENFIGNLSANEMLEIQIYADNATAQRDLSQGKLAGILIIPNGFGQSLNLYYQNPGTPAVWQNVTLDLYVDRGSLVASQAIRPIIQQTLMVTMYGDQVLNTPSPIQIGTPLLINVNSLSQFDFMAPGLFAYATMFLIMTVGQGIAQEKEKGLIKRLNLTPITPPEIMTAEMAANMAVAAVQTVIIFSVAFLIGYRPQTSISGFIIALIIMMIYSLCSVGFGLIVGSMAKNSGMATGLAFIFIIPQMFFGTFMSFGNPTIVNKIVPSYYVTDAITSLFLRGALWNNPLILLDLGTIALFSVIVFLVGILTFRHFGSK
jgi:ABC-2 type transport system permease protein